MADHPRKRGRPAHLSRQNIVQAALTLLREEPGQSLSMQGLARAMKVSPMSLYTHVRNRDDLMQAIAQQVLGGITVQHTPGDWRATITAWAQSLREQILRHPFLAQLMTEGVATPAAWLELSNPLLQALADAGFTGEALADAQRWVSRVVIGGLLMELMMPQVVPEELGGVARALQAMPESNQALWLSILPALGTRSDDEVFDYTLHRTLDALAVLIPAESRA